MSIHRLNLKKENSVLKHRRQCRDYTGPNDEAAELTLLGEIYYFDLIVVPFWQHCKSEANDKYGHCIRPMAKRLNNPESVSPHYNSINILDKFRKAEIAIVRIGNIVQLVNTTIFIGNKAIYALGNIY